MRTVAIALVFAAALMFSGCGNKSKSGSAGQQAVVMLKDGTSFAGQVTDTSTSSISLIAANGEKRTYPMSQVDSIQYTGQTNTASNAPASTAPASTAPASSAPPSSAPPSNGPAVTPVSAPPGVAPPAAAAPAESSNPMQQPAPAQQAPEPPTSVVRTIPAGRSLTVRTNETVNSETASAGQTYSAEIVRPVTDAHGAVIIPKGAAAALVVRSARAQGKIQGRSELALDLESVRISGRRYRVETSDIVERGREGVGENKRTAKFVGGGTVLGTLLGAVAGGGKGAAIGAISGAAAGTATQTLTRGKAVRIPAETVLTFRLEAPIRVTETR